MNTQATPQSPKPALETAFSPSHATSTASGNDRSTPLRAYSASMLTLSRTCSCCDAIAEDIIGFICCESRCPPARRRRQLAGTCSVFLPAIRLTSISHYIYDASSAFPPVAEGLIPWPVISRRSGLCGNAGRLTAVSRYKYHRHCGMATNARRLPRHSLRPLIVQRRASGR